MYSGEKKSNKKTLLKTIDPLRENDYANKKLNNIIKYSKKLLLNTKFSRRLEKYDIHKIDDIEHLLIDIIYQLGRKLKQCKKKRKVTFSENTKECNGNSLKSHSQKYRQRIAKQNFAGQIKSHILNK